MTYLESELEPLNLTRFNLLNGKPQGWLLQMQSLSPAGLCFVPNSIQQWAILLIGLGNMAGSFSLLFLRPSLTCVIMAGLELAI